MAAKNTNDHEKRLTEVEFTMNKIIIPWKDKTELYLEKNKGGIDFATLFDNKLTLAIILTMIGSIFAYAVFKGGL